jgi:hypothetical protein
MPVFIISNPLAEAAARDVALFTVIVHGASAPDAASCRAAGCEVIARTALPDGASLLISTPGDWSVEKLKGVLCLPAEKSEAAWIGSHAERFSLA